jgi:hypothetical protein
VIFGERYTFNPLLPHFYGTGKELLRKKNQTHNMSTNNLDFFFFPEQLLFFDHSIRAINFVHGNFLSLDFYYD